MPSPNYSSTVIYTIFSLVFGLVGNTIVLLATLRMKQRNFGKLCHAIDAIISIKQANYACLVLLMIENCDLNLLNGENHHARASQSWVRL